MELTRKLSKIIFIVSVVQFIRKIYTVDIIIYHVFKQLDSMLTFFNDSLFVCDFW